MTMRISTEAKAAAAHYRRACALVRRAEELGGDVDAARRRARFEGRRLSRAFLRSRRDRGAWRMAAPTERQLELAGRLGIDGAAHMTRGKLADAIGACFEQGGSRQSALPAAAGVVRAG